MRTLEIKDLPGLNLILDRDRILAATIFQRLDALEAALGPPRDPTPPPPVMIEEMTLTKQWEDKIAAWLTAHPGKHSQAAVREALGATAGSKPFKNALANLVAAGGVKFSGKRGKGAEYWIPG